MTEYGEIDQLPGSRERGEACRRTHILQREFSRSFRKKLTDITPVTTHSIAKHYHRDIYL